MLTERRFPANRMIFTRERLIGAAIALFLNQVEQFIREAMTKARL